MLPSSSPLVGLLLLLLLLLLAGAAAAADANADLAPPPPPPSLADRFVARRGARLFFANTTRPFYFVGANLLSAFTDSAHLRDPLHRERASATLDALALAGVSVVRVWCFNSDAPALVLPSSSSDDDNDDDDVPRVLYDRAQVAALDWLVWACKKRGLRVVLTLGSFWTPYKRVEEYAYPQTTSDGGGSFFSSSSTPSSAEEASRLAAAAAERDGSDVSDFYAASSPRWARANAAYKRHAYAMITRVNHLTGLRYNQDPAVMAWALLNEPRLPGGFEPGQQSAHWRWVRDMARFVKRAAPSQLVSASTEGFFVDNTKEAAALGAVGVGEEPHDGDDNNNNANAEAAAAARAAIAASARAARVGALLQHNSGAGAACEGEDWLALSAVDDVDLVTAHLYERQAEWRPQPTPGAVGDNPSWFFCGVDDCYLPWLRSALALRAALSGAGKEGEEAPEAVVAAAAAEDAIAGAAAARVLLPPLAGPSGGAAAFAGLGKPFILEEFGLTWHRGTLEQRASVFKLVMGMARRAAAAGTKGGGGGLSSLAGVMFWQASGNDTDDSDGYVVRVDRPGVVAAALEAAAASSSSSPPPLPRSNLPLASPAEAEALVAGEAAAVQEAAAAGGGGNVSRWWDPSPGLMEAPPDLAAQMMVMITAAPAPLPPDAAPLPIPLPLPARALINTIAVAPSAPPVGGGGRHRRRSRALRWAQDTLDAFRRGPEREACAVRASETWRPYREFNLTTWSRNGAATVGDDTLAWRDLTTQQRAAAEAGLQGAQELQGGGVGDAALFEVALAAASINARVYGGGDV